MQKFIWKKFIFKHPNIEKFTKSVRIVEFDYMASDEKETKLLTIHTNNLGILNLLKTSH